MDDTSKLPCWVQHTIAALVFLAAAFWLTWPQIAFSGEAVVGGAIAQADGWQNVWNLWWLRRSILTGQNPFYTDLLFWPEGIPLGLQTLNPTNALLTLPVLLLAGPLAAYGVAAILGFLLTGWFTYLLALRVTGSWPGALAAGWIVAAAPQHMGRFIDGQLEHVATQWVPLSILLLLQATEQPTLHRGVWLGLSIALVAYTSWYQALFLALVILVWLAWHTATQRQIWPLLRPWLVAIPVLFLLLLPVIPGLIAGITQTHDTVAHFRTQAQLHSADLTALVLPSAYHPLWGATIAAYQEPLHPNSIGWVTTPGYLALFLAVIGLANCWRAMRLWVLLAGIFFLLALGPTLRVHGIDTGIPLPYTLLLEIPGANFARRPTLAAGIALVPLAVLAAAGMHVLWHRFQGWQRLGVCSLLLAAGIVESAPPVMNVWYDDTAPVYAHLRQATGTLLVIPLDPGALQYKSASLRAQMTHQRPIIGGYVARPPDYPLSRGAPFIGQLKNRRCGDPDIVSSDPATILSALNFYQISQIVLHSERLTPERLACAHYLIGHLTDHLIDHTPGLTLTIDADPIFVYAVSPVSPKPFVFLGDGWHYREQDGTRVWRWMRGSGEWYIVNTNDHPTYIDVHARMESLEHIRPLTLTFNQHPIGRVNVTPGYSRTYHMLIRAHPGQNELRLTAPTDRDPDPTTPRDISIAVERVTVTEHPLP